MEEFETAPTLEAINKYREGRVGYAHFVLGLYVRRDSFLCSFVAAVAPSNIMCITTRQCSSCTCVLSSAEQQPVTCKSHIL